MRHGRGSRTAEAVAAARAGHLSMDGDPKIFVDRYAYELIGPLWQQVVRNPVVNFLIAGVLLRKLRPMRALAVARARYAEERLASALERGVTQYVLVGAGLDSFALRTPELAGRLRIFEVDHPATQRMKRERIARLGAAPAHVVYVSVDFETESLSDNLLAAGLQSNQPSFFSWFGVTYYLSEEAIFKTVRSIASCTARGSELTFDYVDKDCFSDIASAAEVRSVMRFSARRGEPWITGLNRAELAEGLRDCGFDLVDSLSADDQMQRYFRGRTDGLKVLAHSHLACATLDTVRHRPMVDNSVIRGATTIEIADVAVVRLEPTGRANGQAILFVHGMWCGAWVWQNYLPFFSALGYTCYGLNLRGHHPSRPVPDIGKVSLSEYLTDVRKVARALGDPILVGHSMGGLLVQKLAETAAPPAVVAITPAPPRGIFALRTVRLLRAAAAHGREIVLGRALIIDQSEAVRLALNGFSTLEQARIYACFVPESGRAAFEMACLGLKVNQARLRCPMLVIAAANDNMTPVQVARKVARKYGADYREYARKAHMIIMEPGWEDVSQDIATWLKAADDMAVRAPDSNSARLEMAVEDQ